MEKIIIDFINEQECVYIVETKDMILDSLEPEIGREVIGTSNKGVVYEYMYQYGIEKWRDIENYSLVSIVDCYSSERGGYDRKKIVCVFDCKTLESTKVDLEIY
jgi:hypothetical protein